jgi:hypothetical protein
MNKGGPSDVLFALALINKVNINFLFINYSFFTTILLSLFFCHLHEYVHEYVHVLAIYIH